jgi:FkbM family methyltransferase
MCSYLGVKFMVSVAIIDVIGLTYDGDTLSKRGLGGSESAVILMSRELAKLGFDVTVFNNCIDNGNSRPGVFDGVKYLDLTLIEKIPDHELSFDVVISSRTVIPFLHPALWSQFAQYSPERFKKIKDQAKHRVVWMHDTFCNGDIHLEGMITHGDVHEIFTLSDFHTSYVTTCDHGARRNFEVLKDHVFMTRNGVVNYLNEVDVSSKDPFLYVYNASVTKGMLPLVNEIWPEIKKNIPQAKLKVIGGYYRFRENAEPDEQEKTWRKMVDDPKYTQLDIEFTGIITQREIANILAKASFMAFPGAFPETFGISTLESLTYNTPLLTTRFGALEETAVEQACYLIDYAIEPNGLFPRINKADQDRKFVNMALQAAHNRYLHQQKMYYCNIVKDICTWDTVALQWKQHLFKKLGFYLSVEEYKKVSKINSRVREVFGRRFSNKEENYIPRTQQQKIVVVAPMYNAEKYIEKCIQSVITQDYDNWEMFVIDDCSSDKSFEVASKYSSSKVHVVRRSQNMGAVFNQIKTITDICDPEDIVMLLDGDDALINDNQIFHRYNNLYDGTTEFTYGSCWSMADNIPLIAQHYPDHIKQSRSYRDHKFNWNMPYTHLRTFKTKLIEGVNDAEFKDEDGNWYKAGGDGSVFYALIERADPSKVKAVSDIVYLYNDMNPLNDYKINGEEQTKNAQSILKKNSASSPSSKFSVVIPTMWRCPDLFSVALDRYVSCPLVDEVIIINNDVQATPTWGILNTPKIQMFECDENIKVNPAWNLGVSLSSNDLICIANDDILFDISLFEKVAPRVTPQAGVHGLITGEAKFGHPQYVDGKINFVEWKHGDDIHGFGQLMFIHKQNWLPIINELQIYFGDDFIFHNQLVAGRKNYLITNIDFKSPFASTTKDKSITEGALLAERPIFAKWFQENPIPSISREVSRMKTILIAVPTNKYIEPETMKSIYDLEVPEGYKTTFQYFYGYQIDQIRNLIAHWATHYDYLFAVDSDIQFKPDTLAKLISHDKDVVSGLYIQRKPGQHILEIYSNGTNVPYTQLKGKGLVEIDGCGFGCVLVKSNVFKSVGYPQFVYKSALDHKDTVSEDTYFCMKAKEKGFHVYADTTILCEHIGSTKFVVDVDPPTIKPQSSFDRLMELSNQRLLPVAHREYLYEMKGKGTNPKVVYDIGACVLHWTREAVNVWPEAQYVAFEAMPESADVFKHFNVPHCISVLSDQDGKEIIFYQNTTHPGGNSYYRENAEINKEADQYFGKNTERKVITSKLDTLVKQFNFPLPDLIKMDVQGAELDVLRGATETLKSCSDVILELQKVEYNKGAPLCKEVIDYMTFQGFDLKSGPFCDNGPDGDYHFTRRQ